MAVSPRLGPGSAVSRRGSGLVFGRGVARGDRGPGPALVRGGSGPHPVRPPRWWKGSEQRRARPPPRGTRRTPPAQRPAPRCHRRGTCRPTRPGRRPVSATAGQPASAHTPVEAAPRVHATAGATAPAPPCRSSGGGRRSPPIQATLVQDGPLLPLRHHRHVPFRPDRLTDFSPDGVTDRPRTMLTPPGWDRATGRPVMLLEPGAAGETTASSCFARSHATDLATRPPRHAPPLVE